MYRKFLRTLAAASLCFAVLTVLGATVASAAVKKESLSVTEVVSQLQDSQLQERGGRGHGWDRRRRSSSSSGHTAAIAGGAFLLGAILGSTASRDNDRRDDYYDRRDDYYDRRDRYYYDRRDDLHTDNSPN